MHIMKHRTDTASVPILAIIMSVCAALALGALALGAFMAIGLSV